MIYAHLQELSISGDTFQIDQKGYTLKHSQTLNSKPCKMIYEHLQELSISSNTLFGL